MIRGGSARRVILLCFGCLMAPAVLAQTIFNTLPPAAPAGVSGSVGRNGGGSQNSNSSSSIASYPVTEGAVNGRQAQAYSPLVDPKVMAQFDQLSNESNDAYLNRMQAQARRAVAEMERVVRDHNAKMKALGK